MLKILNLDSEGEETRTIKWRRTDDVALLVVQVVERLAGRGKTRRGGGIKVFGSRSLGYNL